MAGWLFAVVAVVRTSGESERDGQKKRCKIHSNKQEKSVKISPRSEDATSGRSGNHSEDSFRTSKHQRHFVEGFRRKKKKKKLYDEEVLLGGGRYHDHKFWNRFGSVAFRGSSTTMPMSGGTRMLRARRKDCNVKPNRRLDRKSSRGMLFENEELRMRTITINAEVEQGQHALKKLRRENEQLRREMWCLRDEYDKMEKLLKKREEGEESDQENSDSDDNASQAYESDQDKRTLQDANRDLEGEESCQKLPQFGNEANVRTFDGLSVIDEQTEETQTTESPAGYGTVSRGNSSNRTFSQPTPMQDETCRIPELPPYGYGVESFGDKIQPRKKGPCFYENGSGFPGDWGSGQCDTYDVRPSSPYPYNGSFRPSYQKQFQVLQELPLVPQTSGNAIGENGWIFPDPSKLSEMPSYNVYVDDPVRFLSGKPPDAEACRQGFGFNVIQDRGGPDVFVTGGYSQVKNQVVPTESVEKETSNVEGERENIISNVEAEIDKIEISEKSESDPRAREMTTFTKSPVSRAAAAPQETLHPGKLTMDEAADENDNSISNHVQQSVTCQNSNGQHVRETIATVQQPSNPLPDDMPFAEKPPSSKYQTKLTVTLKSPGSKVEGKAPKKVPGPVVPRNFHPQLRYGMRPEYMVGQRFQTFPTAGLQANVRMGATNGRDCLVSPYAGVREQGDGPFGSLPRLPSFDPKSELGATPSNIPDEMDKDLDVLPDEESLPVPVTQSLVKPVKIPPVPPPRTSSCPKPIIPAPPVGVTALHQRTFRKGKLLHSQEALDHPSEPATCNPLLMSQPIATSSPTISLRGTAYPSSENLYTSKYRKPSYNEDSSLEEFSKHKLKLKEEFARADVPKLNKSLSSPSFGSFRTPRRKQSEGMATSVENILMQKIPDAMSLSEKVEKKVSKSRACQNNASVSSSSGLDSPTKSDSRKRRVSIQFKKKQSHREGKRGEDEGGGKDSTDSRRGSMVQGILSVKVGERHKGKAKGEETDATTSDRERTNSVSSRTSSVMAGSSRRKYSISSNRTYLNEEKIPWCGCWGNGCV